MAEAAGEQGWSDVAEAIVLGLAHDLNNRVLALMGIRELGEEGPLDEELLRLFDDELTRLGTVTRLLRRLAEPPGDPELIDGGALLEAVRELHSRNSALRSLRTEWTVPSGLPPAYVDPAGGTRAVLRALASSGRVALDTGEVLRITAALGHGALVLEVSPAPAGPEALRALSETAESARHTATGLRIRFHAT